jgi:hypothetical protein
MSRLVFLVFGIFALPALAQTTIYVGPGCTHETIQAAVDAAFSNATIRVRSGTYNERVTVIEKNIELIGGHQFCFGEAIDGISTINAGSSGSTLSLLAETGPIGTEFRLVVRNFNLTGGSGVAVPSNLSPGGGLNILARNNLVASATLHNTVVSNNQSTIGGGGIAALGMDGGFVNLRLFDGSRISNNQATFSNAHGGGLMCAGNGRVGILGGSITGNTAGVPGNSEARGGGIAVGGCELNWGTDSIDPGDNWLGDNTVHGGGGGMYVTEGASVSLVGAPFLPGSISFEPPGPDELSLLISLNQATGAGNQGKGGGIWVDNASLTLAGVRLELNDSVQGNGGGIAATGGSDIVISRPISDRCRRDLECSAINNNRAGDTGGAVFARGPDTSVMLSRTVIRNNAGEAGAGADLFAATGSMIELFNSLMYRGTGHNGLFFDPSGPNPYSVWIENNAVLIMRDSTLANTKPTTAVIRFGGSDSVALLGRSIIHESSDVDIERTNVGNTPFVQTDCMLWHSADMESLGGSGTHSRNMIANPEFVDRDQMNFRLQRDSVAVDYCDVPAISERGLIFTDRDLLYRPRGVQVKEDVLHGPWDLGAFEVQPDLIFSDRFE